VTPAGEGRVEALGPAGGNLDVVCCSSTLVVGEVAQRVAERANRVLCSAGRHAILSVAGKRVVLDSRHGWSSIWIPCETPLNSVIAYASLSGATKLSHPCAASCAPPMLSGVSKPRMTVT